MLMLLIRFHHLTDIISGKKKIESGEYETCHILHRFPIQKTNPYSIKLFAVKEKKIFPSLHLKSL